MTRFYCVFYGKIKSNLTQNYIAIRAEKQICEKHVDDIPKATVATIIGTDASSGDNDVTVDVVQKQFTTNVAVCASPAIDVTVTATVTSSVDVVVMLYVQVPTSKSASGMVNV